jgi:hypothetical protein
MAPDFATRDLWDKPVPIMRGHGRILATDPVFKSLASKRPLIVSEREKRGGARFKRRDQMSLRDGCVITVSRALTL